MRVGREVAFKVADDAAHAINMQYVADELTGLLSMVCSQLGTLLVLTQYHVLLCCAVLWDTAWLVLDCYWPVASEPELG
jgi:hypothetical protein